MTRDANASANANAGTIRSGYLPIAETIDPKQLARFLAEVSDWRPEMQALLGSLVASSTAAQEALSELEELRLRYELETGPDAFAHAMQLRQFAEGVTGPGWQLAELMAERTSVAEWALAKLAEDVFGTAAIEEAVSFEALTRAIKPKALEGEPQALRSVRLLETARKRYEALLERQARQRARQEAT